MNKEFRNRVKFWEASNEKITLKEISNFESSNSVLLPEIYKALLLEFGKLSHTKTWYWFYEEDGTDHLIDGTLDLKAQKLMHSNIWDELVAANKHIKKGDFLPIISTHSNNYFFLISVGESDNGKIFDYNYDYEDYKPKLISTSFIDFFNNKIFSSFPIHHKSKNGTIEIRRQNGVEFWDVTSSNFSITKYNGKYSINFWIESDHKTIQGIEDTGDTPVKCEVKLPIDSIPDFSNPWKLNYPNIKEISNNWGEEKDFDYYDNFYYYSHDSFDMLTVEIVKGINEIFYVRLIGEKDDPISSIYGKANYIITAKLKKSKEFKGFWCEE